MTTKTYAILYAEDVPHYGTADIEARHDGEAIAHAFAHDWPNCPTHPDWHGAINRRIIHIEAEDGSIVATDLPLDPEESDLARMRQMYEALLLAREELQYVQKNHPSADDTVLREVLHAVRQAIAKYEGGAS